MPYIKTIWQDYGEDVEGTPINAANLNKMELAIEAIVNTIEATGTSQSLDLATKLRGINKLYEK